MDRLNKIIYDEDPTLPEPKYLTVPTATQPDKSVYDVVVENPQKVGEKKSYVAYTVRTVTTADNKTTEQQRRYNDFFWLYEHLKATHPTCVVPQVPEKTISGKFDPVLLSYRARELSRFLQRVASHPVLRDDEAVQIFLTASEEDFAERRDRKEESPKEAAPKQGFGAKVKDFGFAMGAKVEDPEPWFDEQRQEVTSREAILTQMLQQAQRIVAQYKQLSLAYAEHATKVRELGEGVSDTNIEACCQRQATGLEKFKELLDDMACQVEITVKGSILDYIRELQAIAEVIDRRVPLVRAYTVANKEATSKNTPETLAKRDEALAAVDEFSKAARADIQRVFDVRRDDLESYYLALAKAHQECGIFMAKSWDEGKAQETDG